MVKILLKSLTSQKATFSTFTAQKIILKRYWFEKWILFLKIVRYLVL